MSKVTEWANVAEGVEAGQLLLKDEARRHDRRRLPRCSHGPVTSPRPSRVRKGSAGREAFHRKLVVLGRGMDYYVILSFF